MELPVIATLSYPAALDAPLRWEAADGLTGEEVIDVPTHGEVRFFDGVGPVMRVKDCEQVRWRCIIKLFGGQDLRFRVTVVKKYDGTFVSAIPWIHPEVVHCTLHADDHSDCEPWLCNRVAERVSVITRKVFEL